MRNNWIEVELSVFLKKKTGSVNPNKHEDEFFELYSIPAYDQGKPEIIKGSEIGSSKKVVSENDVLLSRIVPHIQRSWIVQPSKGYRQIGSTEWIIFDGTTIPPKYLKFFLLSYEFHSKFMTTISGVGGSLTRANPNQTAKFKIPIAPLPEQRAIVAKIEQLFSELDNGIASLKAAKQKLEIYRQAVLKKAFEGELTQAWREKQDNLPTADELLEQIKKEREAHYQQQLKDWQQSVIGWDTQGRKGKKPGKPKKIKEVKSIQIDQLAELAAVPDGWKYIKIGQTFLSLDQGWSPKCESNPANKDEWGVIKTTAIQRGSFLENENKKLPDNLTPRQQHELENGNILITRAGPRVRVGVCCLVKNVRPKLINCDKAYRIKLIITNPNFIVYLLNSPVYMAETEKIKSGINDSGVNLKQDIFTNVPIPICSLAEQHQIVQEIESRLSVCDKMAATIEDNLQKAEALRQSILKKAFEGKLLSEQELQACQREPDWEPAAHLLERIQEKKDGVQGKLFEKGV